MNDNLVQFLQKTGVANTYTPRQILDNEELMKVCFFMFAGLAHEVLSGDVWALAYFRAKDMATRHGMSVEDFEEHFNIVKRAANAARTANPLHTMF